MLGSMVEQSMIRDDGVAFSKTPSAPLSTPKHSNFNKIAIQRFRGAVITGNVLGCRKHCDDNIARRCQ